MPESHLPECPKSGCPACYAAALDAARDAVAALDEHDSCVGFDGPAIYREDALDAIDALRGAE